MPIYSYAWATGHDVALASLTNIETDLATYAPGRTLAPRTQAVARFPQRLISLDGVEVGFGDISHEWTFAALPADAFQYIVSTYCNSDGSGAAVTIYTRRHDLDNYGRYNAYLAYPQPIEDYSYRNQYVLDVRLRFTGLEAL